jgi:hypothetical protein
VKKRRIHQAILTLTLLMAVACTPSGHLRPDVADGTLTTIALSCEVAEAWCNPAAPVLPADVCRWLIPGCLGVHGMAALLLPAATPPLVPDAKLTLMAVELSPACRSPRSRCGRRPAAGSRSRAARRRRERTGMAGMWWW